jgi:hypothetical protein
MFFNGIGRDAHIFGNGSIRYRRADPRSQQCQYRVDKKSGNTLILDVGRVQGVTKGMCLKAVDGAIIVEEVAALSNGEVLNYTNMASLANQFGSRSRFRFGRSRCMYRGNMAGFP